VCHHPSVSLNKEKVSCEISENKIAVCEKMQGQRSGNFSDLNSACSTVLVPVKIFQFQDMHYENRFLGTFQGHSKQPILLLGMKSATSDHACIWCKIHKNAR
jgi:hypothetical protein